MGSMGCLAFNLSARKRGTIAKARSLTDLLSSSCLSLAFWLSSKAFVSLICCSLRAASSENEYYKKRIRSHLKQFDFELCIKKRTHELSVLNSLEGLLLLDVGIFAEFSVLGLEPANLLPVLGLECLQDRHLPSPLFLNLALVKVVAGTIAFVLLFIRVHFLLGELLLESLNVGESRKEFLPLGLVLVTSDRAIDRDEVLLKLLVLLGPEVDHALNGLLLFAVHKLLGFTLEGASRLGSKLVAVVLLDLNTEHVQLGLDAGLLLLVTKLKGGLELLLLGEVGDKKSLGLVNNLDLAVAVLHKFVMLIKNNHIKK